LDLLAGRLRLAWEKLEEADAAAYNAFMAWSWKKYYRVEPSHACDPIERTAVGLACDQAATFREQAGTAQLERQLEELERRVQEAKAKYEEAERNAQAGFAKNPSLGFGWAGLLSGNAVIGVLATAGSLLLSVGFDAAGNLLVNGEAPTWADLLRRHHAELRGVGAAVYGPFLNPSDMFRIPDTKRAARGITAFATLFAGDGLRVEVDRLSKKSDRAPQSIEDLIRRIKTVRQSDPDKADSQIAVTKVTAQNGQVSWLVTIPGTQGMGFGWDSNAADNGTNLRAVPGDQNAIGLATVAAMIDSGVKPGEPVVLSGHSQGGIVGSALAADPEFTAQFSVAAVLTAGSPVSLLKPANSAQWLSLEHHQDAVPTLDGANNPRTANHTTVVRDLKTASDPAIRKGSKDAGVAHSGDTYANTAKLIDKSSSPSVAAWREAASPIFDRDAKVETTTYKVRRS
jgi:hypothetical protein